MNDFFFVGGAELMDSHTSARTKAARRRSTDPVPANGRHRWGSGAQNNNPLMPKLLFPQATIPPGSFASGTMPTPAMQFPAYHSRSASFTSRSSPAPKGKRLSINIPIQPAFGNVCSASPTNPVTNVRLSACINQEQMIESSDADFMVTLAAQERRVLELRDELHKAEEDLARLKKRWETHEAIKKRDDVRQVQRMRPVSTPVSALDCPAVDDADGSSLWMQKEMEKRKALFSGRKMSQRTVFSASRHTRTLSLLSPEKRTFNQPLYEPHEVAQSHDGDRPPLLRRSSTTSDFGHLVQETADKPVHDLGPLHQTPHQKELLLRTGRQMATDLKEGLWTFIEDLRQATVGDEGIYGTQSRVAIGAPNITKQASKARVNGRRREGKDTLIRTTSTAERTTPAVESATGNLSSEGSGTGLVRGPSGTSTTHLDSKSVKPALIDFGGSFWKEHGLDEPIHARKATIMKPRSPNKSRQPKALHTPDQETESWDNWVSPQPKSASIHSSSSNSVSEDRNSLSTGTASPQSSISSNDDTIRLRSTPGAALDTSRDAIPWPVLTKLTPGHLRRTASLLMREWVSTLSPSLDAANQRTDYFWRVPSPGLEEKDTNGD